MTRIAEFIQFINPQVGSAYVLGAQNDIIDFESGAVTRNGRIVSSNYISWVKSKESTTTNATRALTYINKKKAEGVLKLACFDCSGLAVAFLCDQKGWIDGDKTASSLYDMCDHINKSDLRAGDFVFHDNGVKVHHVGYVVAVHGSCVMIVEAASRTTGVISRDISAYAWNKFGRLPQLQESVISPFIATCGGNLVNLRDGASTSYRVLTQVKKDDLMLALPAVNNWCRVATFVNETPFVGYMHSDYVKAT